MHSEIHTICRGCKNIYDRFLMLDSFNSDIVIPKLIYLLEIGTYVSVGKKVRKQSKPWRIYFQNAIPAAL